MSGEEAKEYGIIDHVITTGMILIKWTKRRHNMTKKDDDDR